MSDFDPTTVNLSALPPVVRESSFRLTDADNEIFVPWAETAGLIKPAGAGLYYNLVCDPHWENHLVAAVLMAQPKAVLVGPSVLHGFGCQTQIPHALWVASPQPLPTNMVGVKWVAKPHSWFREFIPGATLYGLPSLTPQQALDDAAAFPISAWLPDEDDIDMHEVRRFSP